MLLKDGLQMLCAPRNIGSLSSLFVWAELVDCVFDYFKMPFERLNQFVSLRFRTLFVRLHCQENQITGFGSLVRCEYLQSLREQFDILFVVGNDETVVYLFGSFS
jgi:hypothetical protein